MAGAAAVDAAAVADAGRAVAEVAAGAGAGAAAVVVAVAGDWAGDDGPEAGRDPPAHPATRTAASTEPIAIGDRFLTLALSPLRRGAGKTRPGQALIRRRFSLLRSWFFVIVFDRKIIFPNGPWYMSETPVPRDPGRDEDPPGMPAGPGDHPSLGSPEWRLAPCRPDWDEAYLAAIAEDEYPGDADLYEDPDNAPAG